MAVENLGLVCHISGDSSEIEMKELVVGNNLATCVKSICNAGYNLTVDH